MERVVVPLDGSHLAEAVLDPVVDLLRPERGTVVLLHALHPIPPIPGRTADYARRERRRAERYLSRLATRLGHRGVNVETRVRIGSAPRMIVRTAIQEDADLVALSSHGLGGKSGEAFGSVAERVLRTTSIPVLVYRGHPRARFRVRTILVPLDSDKGCVDTVATVAHAAAQWNARVSLLVAGRRVQGTLLRARDILTRLEVTHRTSLRPGRRADAVLKAADRSRADLVAVTASNAMAQGRFFFAEAQERLLARCRRPLLIVRSNGETSSDTALPRA